MSRRKHRSKHSPQKFAGVLNPSRMALLIALAALPSLFNIQSGASFEPDKAAVLIVLAMVAFIDFLRRSWQTGVHRIVSALHHSWALLLAILAIWAVIITLASTDPVTSLWGNYDRGYGLLTVLAGMLFLVVAWDMARSGLQWLLVGAALLGAIIPIFYGSIQMANLDPVRGYGVSFPLGERASSTLGNPLFLGDYLLLVIFLGLARRVLQPPIKSWARRALEIFIGAAFLLLVLTFSRSAYLGLFAGWITFFIFWQIQRRRRAVEGRNNHVHREFTLRRKKPRLTAAWLAALLGSVIALMLLWPRLQHGGTIQQRLLIWQGVGDLIRHQPRIWLAGLGFDVLSFRLAPYLSPTLGHFEPDFAFRIPDRAHSLPLSLLITGGLPWLLGWALLGGLALWRLTHSRHPLTPWLAAIILGRGVLLLFSFPTHAPDMLFWVVLGLSFGLAHNDAFILNAPESLERLLVAAFGVFGFSLSAAWPGGLLLWSLASALLVVFFFALFPSRNALTSRTQTLVLVALIFPAILLNQRIGISAQLGWAWLLLWLVALAIAIPESGFSPRLRILEFVSIASLLFVITIPRLSDIAYKGALLASDDIHRDQYFSMAIRLSPYDHIIESGMAWVLAQRLTHSMRANPGYYDHVTRLYLAAMKAQPLAPEPPADLARWLSQLTEISPAYAAQAQDAFDRALALSPNDIQTLNDEAMLWAQIGRPADAIAELRRLLALDPLYGPTYRNLAEVYRRIGDESAARTVLEQGREKVPWWDGWEQ